MGKLTLALAKGIKHIDIVTVEHDGESYEIEIRPLRHSESKEVQSILSRGVKVNQKMIGKSQSKEVQVDTATLTEAQYDAWMKAAALGTIDSEWTTDSIDKTWNPKWIELVGEKIMELSGIESMKKQAEKAEAEDIDSFRKE